MQRLRRYLFCDRFWKVRIGIPGFARPKHKREELRRQTATTFGDPIRISLLVPLYKTPRRYLRAMMRSVLRQTYPHWELCLADGSGEKEERLSHLVKRYAKGDPRVHFCRLEENRGISENTNACLSLASGEYLALLDHDDCLDVTALWEVARVIQKEGADLIYTDEATFRYTPHDAYWPHYKPDFSPDLLRSYNYICHLTVASRILFDRCGGRLQREYDGSQDYDLLLRLSEQASCIRHIPKVLYFWRAHRGSVALNPEAKPYALEAAKRAIEAHLKRIGLVGRVEDAAAPSTYRIRYTLAERPLISVLIPNKDQIGMLERCLQAICERTEYPNYEVLVIENNSTEAETFSYYKALSKRYERVRLLSWKGGFHYSAINNFAVEEAKGEYVILLNNDVEILTPDWIEEMLMFGQREDVGAVGALLYYPNRTVQHAGVILGIGGVAGHAHKHLREGNMGYFYRLSVVQNLSAVTGACMLLRASLYRSLGGMSMEFPVAFNDVDLCMRIRKAGYRIVFTPFAKGYHHESLSRGKEDTPEKQARFLQEINRFREKWGKELERGDPYYHPRLTLQREDFSPKRGREMRKE
ncbi:MAG: glycosyltransferase family 2 protein [Clostridia bacterium]|nr:glycosyltransferase family 2 protein [Clostridia bacterium]